MTTIIAPEAASDHHVVTTTPGTPIPADRDAAAVLERVAETSHVWDVACHAFETHHH